MTEQKKNRDNASRTSTQSDYVYMYITADRSQEARLSNERFLNYKERFADSFRFCLIDSN